MATSSRIVATVIVPTYGRPSQLQACLSALAEQSLCEPWEVVVVDDGNPQPIAGFIDPLLSSTLSLRVIRQQNSGPAAARNRGVEEARGRFVAFTDDDCLPDSQWLSTLLRAGMMHPDALIGGRTTNGLSENLFSSTSQLIVDFVYDHYNRDPEQAYFFTSNNFLCSRVNFIALGGFDLSFRRAGAEDRDFCDRWRQASLPLLWRLDAAVEHRHVQSLHTFCDLHFRYGRGACLYHKMRRARSSGTIFEDIGFHFTLFSRVRRTLSHRPGVFPKMKLLFALLMWQVANAAGFVFEGLCSMGIHRL